MSHHTLKKFTWNALEGRMFVEEKLFESIDHIWDHLDGLDGFDSYKIYDHQGQLVHSGSPTPVDTYA